MPWYWKEKKEEDINCKVPNTKRKEISEPNWRRMNKETRDGQDCMYQIIKNSWCR